MKKITEKERKFLFGLSESIGEIVSANTGILSALAKLNNSPHVTAIVPHTEKIADTLKGMLAAITEYSQVTEQELNAVS